ncbi:hypothetical protein LOD99_14906 [Oopsacas minuta]|uniref:Myotrophin n=1 Tax=Oopsacas minuta TaxID=111878 RepID=A0AAV7KDD4_9METZ|nr:hypothetical protein LOD99_14906 [Oopsacas minuta]
MGEDFLWAVKNGDIDKVITIVGDNIIDINADISGGRAAIHFASDYGQKDVCEYLLSKGADVNKVDKHGITPLLAAIWEGHLEVCELLIAKGAQKNGTTPDGATYNDSTDNEGIKALLK